MNFQDNQSLAENALLALAETVEDLDVLAPFVQVRDTQWIALSPFADQALTARSISHKTVDDFSSADDLWESVAEETPGRIARLCSAVDGRLREEGFNDSTLGCYGYNLAILFDGVMGRLYLLRSMLEQLAPTEVAFCSSPLSNEGYMFSNRDTLWGACAALVAQNLETHIRQRPGGNGSMLGLGVRRKKWTTRVGKSSPLAQFTYAYKALGLRSALLNVRRGKDVQMLGAMYEWSAALRLLSRAGHGIGFKSSVDAGKEAKEEAQRIWRPVKDSLSKEEAFKGAFVFQGFDFYSLVSAKVDDMVVSGLAQHLEARKNRGNSPKAVLISYAEEGDKWIYLQAQRKRGARVLVWPHGPSGFWYSEKSEAPVLHQYADHLLLYGEGAAETYQPIAKRDGFVASPVGSSSLDRLVNTRGGSEGDFILYALNNYFENNLYYYWYPAWSDIRAFAAHKKIFAYLNSLEETDVVIKYHPNPTYRLPPIEVTNPRIRTVRDKPKLTELIPNARAIIVETMTTTCLQAITGHAPVFVLVTNKLLAPKALELLRKRAVCAESAEELVQALDDYIQRGHYPADVYNNEALCAFGTYLNDGKSAQRAAALAEGALRGLSESGTRETAGVPV